MRKHDRGEEFLTQVRGWGLSLPRGRRAFWLSALLSMGLAFGACGDKEGDGDRDLTELTDGEDDDSTTIDAIQFDLSETIQEVVERPPEPGEFGYTCEQNIDCHSGWCIETADGKRCTQSCDEGCPDGFLCRQAPGTDPIFICMPRFITLCDPCHETSECNLDGSSGNYCITAPDGGRFCGVACEEDHDCANEKYECALVPVGGGMEAKQCVPREGEQCTCSPRATRLQKSTVCRNTNEHGSCEGSRACTVQGLSACDADTPAPEICNGKDDDCNGVIDDLPEDYTCQITNEFGTCPGRGTCVDGHETCEGRAPAPEICDGIDNDCDGITDNVESCDDGNPCTVDLCDPQTQECIHVNDNTLSCDDGDICTQTDKCVDGVCVGFNPMICDDGNACTTDICDPTVGCLSSFADGLACESGDPCTVDDSCNRGVCVPGGPKVCETNNPCTVATCVPGVGCQEERVSDGTVCRSPDARGCSEGICHNGICMDQPVREGQACTYSGTTGSCQDAVCQGGICSLQPKPSGTICDTTKVCPSCVDLVGQVANCCFGALSVRVNKLCNSTGQCNITETPNVTCGSADCGGSCAGSCIPACGIGICIQ